MLINASTMDALFTGFNAAFKDGFSAARSYWRDVAMHSKSSTGKEVYPFPRSMAGNARMDWRSRDPSIAAA